MSRYTIRAFGMELSASCQGAQITSWKDTNGSERIWNGNPDIWAEQAPILFPVCGSTKELSIDGQPFPLPKHGFVKNALWQLENQEDDALVFSISDDESSRSVYPFHFKLTETLRLIPQGFSCTFTVTNPDEETLPFCLGAHPGLICPMEAGATFNDYDIVFDCPEEGRICNLAEGGMISGTYDTIPLEKHRVLSLTHQWFDDRDTLLFDHLSSKALSLIIRKTGHGLRAAFPDFNALALWTMPGKQANYLCIEPWNGIPQTFGGSCRMEDKLYLQRLTAHESVSYNYTLTMI